MAMAPELKALVEAMPEASEGGKIGRVDKAAVDQSIAQIEALGPEAVQALVKVLEAPGDIPALKVQYALHALAVHVSRQPDDARRRAFAEALAGALAPERPKDVLGFILRQLQVAGGAESISPLGKYLLDADVHEYAAQALVAIGPGSIAAFRAALPRAEGKLKLTIIQALGTLRDGGSAAAFRQALTDADREIRLAAGWALANLGEASAAEALLKAAETEGYERIAATDHCLLLAENLSRAGRKEPARSIYAYLRDSRTSPAEQHVREAAERGLAAT
jgi:HEAT repeat protein